MLTALGKAAMLCVLSLALLGCATRTAPSPRSARDLPLSEYGLTACEDGDRLLELDVQRPVAVLVHGCRSSAGRLHALASGLERGGYQAFCYRYDSRDTIRATGTDLRHALSVLEQRTGVREVMVVGHSQGGLVARAALEADRQPTLRARHRLVTVAAPLRGVEAARTCGSRVLRFLSLGATMAICRLVAGANWDEIHPLAAGLRAPRRLDGAVREHLVVATDERHACRTRQRGSNTCVARDHVFSQAEQRNAEMERDVRVRVAEVAAGHVEIVAESGEMPLKLLGTLARHGLLVSGGDETTRLADAP